VVKGRADAGHAEPNNFTLLNELKDVKHINEAVEEIDIVTDVLDGDAASVLSRNPAWNVAACRFRDLSAAQLRALDLDRLTPTPSAAVAAAAAAQADPSGSLTAALTVDRRDPADPERGAGAFPRLRRLTVSYFTRDAHGGADGARALRAEPGEWIMDDARVSRLPGEAPPSPVPRAQPGSGRGGPRRRALRSAPPPRAQAALPYPPASAAAAAFRRVYHIQTAPPLGTFPAAVPRLLRSHRRLTSYYTLLEAVGVRPAGTGVGGVGHGDHKKHVVGARRRREERERRRRLRRRRSSGAMQVDDDDNNDDDDGPSESELSGSEYEGPERFEELAAAGPAPPWSPSTAPATAPARAGGDGKRTRQRFPLLVRGSAELMRAVARRAAADAGELAWRQLAPAGDARGRPPLVREFYLRGLAYGMAGDADGAQAARDFGARTQRFRGAPVWTADLRGMWNIDTLRDPVAVTQAWHAFQTTVRKLSVCVWGRRSGSLGDGGPMAWDGSALWRYVSAFADLEELELCVFPLSLIRRDNAYMPMRQFLHVEIPWHQWHRLESLHLESTYFALPNDAWFQHLQPTLRRLTIKHCGMSRAVQDGWIHFITAICFLGFNLDVFTLDRCWISDPSPNAAGTLAPFRLLEWAPAGQNRGLNDPPFLDMSNLQQRIVDEANGSPQFYIFHLRQRCSMGQQARVDTLEFKEDGDQM
jgi:hypothetical protein